MSEPRDKLAEEVEFRNRPYVENKRLRAENQRLREALRLQDPRNASECFERIAADFQRKTGLMAPGKDVHPAMNYGQEDDDKRRALWRSFVNEWHERFFDAALEGSDAPKEKP